MNLFLFPGQGTQKEKMYSSLHPYEEKVDFIFTACADITGVDIKKICAEGDEKTLMRPLYTQLCISVMNCAWDYLLKEEGIFPSMVAGHSLGTYSAAYSAKSLSLTDLFYLVLRRAKCMESVQNKGVLCAVQGNKEEAEELCQGLNVAPALFNAPRQTVLGGEANDIRLVVERAEKKGMVACLLPLSNAFHTFIMQEMEEPFAKIVEERNVQAPVCPVLLNGVGTFSQKKEEIKNDFILQCTHPVLWTDGMKKICEEKEVVAIEVGMGQTLTNLLKKHDRKIRTYCVAPTVGANNVEKIVNEIK